MSKAPDDLKYTESHEWVRVEADNVITVGITDHAQAALGDMVFVETPEIGAVVAAQDACAVVESVKTASDIYSPASGEVIETNADLTENPELVNEQPYDSGWIFQLRIEDVDELENMMDAQAYAAFCETEE